MSLLAEIFSVGIRKDGRGSGLESKFVDGLESPINIPVNLLENITSISQALVSEEIPFETKITLYANLVSDYKKGVYTLATGLKLVKIADSYAKRELPNQRGINAEVLKAMYIQLATVVVAGIRKERPYVERNIVSMYAAYVLAANEGFKVLHEQPDAVEMFRKAFHRHNTPSLARLLYRQ